MSLAHDMMERIFTDLSRGYAEIGVLGQGKAKLTLDSPKGRAQYADMMRPNFAAALKQNRKLEWLIYASLAILFVAAIFLTILASGWGWNVPFGAGLGGTGLGCSAAGCIKKLINIRQQNIKIMLIPEVLPLLQPEDITRIIKGIF
jgi:hypothetical protein